MNRAHHLVLVAAAIMGLLAVAALLDGPSDLEFEHAVQADLQDAIAQAGHDAPAVRLELARLEAERIEPAPAAVLPRYAMLETQP
jgi:hypothetical protein